MGKRGGFSLVEISVVALIACFIVLSLVMLYSTAHRHVFQDYRSNTVKEKVSAGMMAIRNATGQATRIDLPAINTAGAKLAVSANVDQLTGCYPIKPGQEAAWSLFCTVQNDSNIQLYYYTGSYAANPACACPNNCAATTPAFNILCGESPGGVLFAEYLEKTSVFSRSWTGAKGIPPNDFLSVRVGLRSIWMPPENMNSVQRPVDYSMTSVFSVSRAGF